MGLFNTSGNRPPSHASQAGPPSSSPASAPTQSEASSLDLSGWQELSWRELGFEHLGESLLVVYPDSYAKDYTLGSLEYVHVAKGLSAEVGLRGGAGVKVLLRSDSEQERFFVRRGV